jgi:hypothetical protein
MPVSCACNCSLWLVRPYVSVIVPTHTVIVPTNTCTALPAILIWCVRPACGSVSHRHPPCHVGSWVLPGPAAACHSATASCACGPHAQWHGSLPARHHSRQSSVVRAAPRQQATTARQHRTSAPHVKHRTRSTWCPMQREGQQKACVDVFSAHTSARPTQQTALQPVCMQAKPHGARERRGGGTRVSSGCNRRRDMELPQDNAVC